MRPDIRPTINVLQAGRALAAFLVVVHHAAQASASFDRPNVVLSVLGKGYVGVDFFFVLSGFIIYHSTARRKSVGEYALARIKRVLLPYLPVGLIIALLYTFLPGVSEGSRSWDWLATLTLFPAGRPALSVAWTLQHEMTFYALFGMLFYSRILWWGLAAWAALIVFAPFSGIPFATINLEFIMGILVARLYRAEIGHWLLLPAAVAAIAVWVMLGALRDHSILVGLACALGMLQLTLVERRGGLRMPSCVGLLGAASYALYLVQNVTISIVARLVPHEWTIIMIVGVFASLATGFGYYWFVEKPLLRVVARRPIFASASDRHSSDLLMPLGQ